MFLPTKREALKETNVSPCIFFDTHSYLKVKYWQNLSRKQTVTLNCYVSRRVSCINQQLQKTLQDCRTVIRNPKNIESMKRSKKEHTRAWPVTLSKTSTNARDTKRLHRGTLITKINFLGDDSFLTNPCADWFKNLLTLVVHWVSWIQNVHDVTKWVKPIVTRISPPWHM